MLDLSNLGYLQQALRMRLRMQYTVDGEQVTEVGEVNTFPPATWQ